MEGEFTIIKGYGDEERAAVFSVIHPHKEKKGDYVVYTIIVSCS